ncbi:MAG: carboxypeptidase-like regulatory domain-containing protein [Bacteroidota bacterium]
MTSPQEAKLNMFRATQKHCNENPTIIATIPVFATAVQLLDVKIAALLATAQQEDIITKGITIDKSEAKLTLCSIAADTAAPIIAYASVNSNNALLEKVKYSYTELIRTKDDQLAPRCQNICDLATANLAELIDYGISQPILDSLQSAIDAYQSKVPDPRNAAAQKSTIRKNIITLIAEANKVLKFQMDKTAVGFKASHPDFYSTYKSNRIIINPSKTSTTVRGTITSAAGQTFIKDVTITINETGASAKTDQYGEYQLKKIPAGTYTLTFTAENFTTITQTDVVIKLGQINKLDITLQPTSE